MVIPAKAGIQKRSNVEKPKILDSRSESSRRIASTCWGLPPMLSCESKNGGGNDLKAIFYSIHFLGGCLRYLSENRLSSIPT
ncbi:MAG: hypothetical protein AAB089_05155, partial [Nitrospirota bacterium]